MRFPLILAALVLVPALACAQSGQSGRTFRRPTRLPETPAAAPVAAEAAVTTRAQPLRRLRSGRAWSRYHFSRLPAAAGTEVSTVEASTQTALRVTRFWGRHLPR